MNWGRGFRGVNCRVGFCAWAFIRAPLVCWGVSNQGRQAADGMTMANWHRVVGTHKQTAAIFILLFLIPSSWIAAYVEQQTGSWEREREWEAYIARRRKISLFKPPSVSTNDEKHTFSISSLHMVGNHIPNIYFLNSLCMPTWLWGLHLPCSEDHSVKIIVFVMTTFPVTFHRPSNWLRTDLKINKTDHFCLYPTDMSSL